MDRSPPELDQRETLSITPQYDPWYLTELRQPRPRDLPPHLDASIFTFDDAFQDLMALHFDGQMTDIRASYAQRLFLRFIWPQGEPFAAQRMRHLALASGWQGSRNGPGLRFEEGPKILSGYHAGTEDDLWGWARAQMETAAGEILPLLAGEINRQPGAKTRFTDRLNEPEHETQLAEHIQKREQRQHPQSSWPNAYEALKGLFVDDGTDLHQSHAAKASSGDMMAVKIFENSQTPVRTFESWRRELDSEGNRREVVQSQHTGPGGQLITVQSERTLDAHGNTVSVEHTVTPVVEDAPVPRSKEIEYEERNRPKYTSWLWK